MNLTKITQEEYEHLEEQKVVSPSKESSAINKLMNIYKRWEEKNTAFFEDELFVDIPYLSARKMLQKNLFYTSQDITVFSSQLVQSLKEDESIKIGVFVSALINNHYAKTKQKEAYIVITEDSDLKDVQFLCYKNNGATVHIEGDCWSDLCSHMKKGKITITGNAGYCAGTSMKGGTLTAFSALSGLGQFMQGGTIYITGDCEKFSHLTSITHEGGNIIYLGKKIQKKDLT